ncbi:MAG TPA: hypothetical protein VNS09_20380 [Solirubrobacter sp.]|nr:hypothetical protein [Solirubrobacter sp.]
MLALKQHLEEQAGWRFDKSLEYPEDARNLHASRELEGWANYVAELIHAGEIHKESRAWSALDATVSGMYSPCEEAARLVNDLPFYCKGEGDDDRYKAWTWLLIDAEQGATS